jgi:beta-mannanase
MVIGVPNVPTLSGSPVGTLASGASGAYDASFKTLAKRLVAVGQGNAILRLGWEFNGNWETWSVLNPTDATNYAAFFRRIVTTMRKVSPDFQYVWNLSDGSGTTSLFEQAYPGNGYVDYIGDDVYDESCASNPTPQSSWKNLLRATAGLDWASRFAAVHGKPVVIPEWGIDGALGSSCTGLGDDPYFVRKMAAWLTTHHAAFSIYFDFDAGDGSHRLQDAAYPKSLAAFRQSF